MWRGGSGVMGRNAAIFVCAREMWSEQMVCGGGEGGVAGEDGTLGRLVLHTTCSSIVFFERAV